MADQNGKCASFTRKLESLLETMEIILDKEFMESIRKGELDYLCHRFEIVRSEDLDGYLDSLFPV